MISVIIPAYQEEAVIGGCLGALVAQTVLADRACAVEAIVVANGSTDRTAEIARAWVAPASKAGLRLEVVELTAPGKAQALNEGDRRASGSIRVYLDADVICGPGLLRDLSSALATDAPRFASGELTIRPPQSAVSRAYGRVWTALPFVRDGVAGCGLYAVHAAGRRRWAAFPAIHSDDKFVRLCFAPEERVQVPSRYLWPLPEGLRNLVRVRRRWCEGNLELRRCFPELERNNGPGRRLSQSLRRALNLNPIDLTVFSAVYALASGLARLTPAGSHVHWRRGR